MRVAGKMPPQDGPMSAPSGAADRAWPEGGCHNAENLLVLLSKKKKKKKAAKSCVCCFSAETLKLSKPEIVPVGVIALPIREGIGSSLSTTSVCSEP